MTGQDTLTRADLCEAVHEEVGLSRQECSGLVERTLELVVESLERGETVKLGGWETGLLTASGWSALILPAITLGFYNMTLIMRLVRAEMLEVLRADYMRFGRARGLRERDLYFGHALRNTLIPVITIAGLQIGSLIAFAIVTETVFQWPGVGLLSSPPSRAWTCR